MALKKIVAQKIKAYRLQSASKNNLPSESGTRLARIASSSTIFLSSISKPAILASAAMKKTAMRNVRADTDHVLEYIEHLRSVGAKRLAVTAMSAALFIGAMAPPDAMAQSLQLQGANASGAAGSTFQETKGNALGST